MNNLVSDIRTAAEIFKDIRQERKNGNEVTVKKRIVIPFMNNGAGFYDTVEGCTLANCSKNVDDIAREAFDRLTREERHRLSFAPKDGEFMERARFWKELLKPLMTPSQYTEAITAILQWYIHIKHLRKDV